MPEKNSTSAAASLSGLLFMVSAPSGAGKSSLVKSLLAKDPKVHLSISYTTRSPRPGEADGREYNFITVEDFQGRRQRGEFLESAFVHGNYYGTSLEWIRRERSLGHDVLLEIDWQGAQQVRKAFHDVISVFILPPSFEVLRARLVGRGTDAADVIERRLAGAHTELARAPEFDFVIINDDFDRASTELRTIVQASRLRYLPQARAHGSVFRSLGIPV